MPSVTAMCDVDSGPEPIWELMSTPARYPDFVDATDRMVDVGSGPFGVGYVYKEYGGIKPFLSESTWTVTEFEPLHHQTHLGDDGKVRMPLNIALTPEGDRTRLTITFGLRPRWFVAPVALLLWPIMMRRRAQAVLDRTVMTAKQIVEAELAGSPPP
jgi:hypothetical protein